MIINKVFLHIDPKYDSIYIENISKEKVLEATNDGDVILEDFKEGKAEQIWRKRGYPYFRHGGFSLENSKFCTWELGGCANSEVPKILTAISKSGLKIKGKITLIKITVADLSALYMILLILLSKISFSFEYNSHLK